MLRSSSDFVSVFRVWCFLGLGCLGLRVCRVQGCQGLGKTGLSLLLFSEFCGFEGLGLLDFEA